jgi:hypothetical protein
VTGSHDEPDESVIWMVLGTGLVGVAVIALLGLLWVLRGRDDEDEQVAPAEAALGAAPEDSISPVLSERMIRRARLRSVEDPILAAMGLDEEHAGEGRSKAGRAGQVSIGPGERQTYRARNRRGGKPGAG